MNFLAHYFLAKEKEGSPLFIAGSLLPDIAKKAGFSTPVSLFINEFHLNPKLVSGVQFHLKTDKNFHSSNLFIQGMAHWKHNLQEHHVGISKSFFLHHLLFEMWLDRILLKTNPFSGFEMYKNLESIDRKLLTEFTRNFYNDNSGKIGAAFDKFLSRKFILSYADTSPFIEIALGVFGNVTGQSLPNQLDKIILAKLDSMEVYETYFIQLWEKFKHDLLKS